MAGFLLRIRKDNLGSRTAIKSDSTWMEMFCLTNAWFISLSRCDLSFIPCKRKHQPYRLSHNQASVHKMALDSTTVHILEVTRYVTLTTTVASSPTTEEAPFITFPFASGDDDGLGRDMVYYHEDSFFLFYMATNFHCYEAVPTNPDIASDGVSINSQGLLSTSPQWCAAISS